MINPVDCETFLKTTSLCLDVRAPVEFSEGHIPLAENLPLLNDENRKAIGICYKQNGKDAAIALGYELVNPIRQSFIEFLESHTPDKKIKIYCARGGLRSGKMAEFLSEGGYDVTVLKGGYKAYRNLVLDTIRKFNRVYILSGNTGSGKTEILEQLRQQGEQVLDLEALANHKGSAFGALGEKPQPTNAQFCNMVFENIKDYDLSKRLWVESESSKIGKVSLPEELWKTMVSANGIEIVIPMEKRVEYIVSRYGPYGTEPLKASLGKLAQRLGDKEIAELSEKIDRNELHDVVMRLLKYYDKGYMRSRDKTNCQNFVKFNLESVDALVNSRLLLQHLQEINQN